MAQSSEQIPAYPLFQHLLRLYPPGFRQRFEPEMLQVYRDILRYGRQDGGRKELARLLFGIFLDVILSAACEWLSVWRQSMKQKEYILKTVGVTLISAWVVLMGWFILPAYIPHLKLPDPVEKLLGQEISSLEDTVFSLFMLTAPMLTVLALFLSKTQAHWSKEGDQYLLRLQIRKMGKVSLAIILGCSALSLLILAVLVQNYFMWW